MTHRHYGGRSNPFLRQYHEKAAAKPFRFDGKRLTGPVVVLLTVILIVLLRTIGGDYVWLLLDYCAKL